jgi:hypothetical protein
MALVMLISLLGARLLMDNVDIIEERA